MHRSKENKSINQLIRVAPDERPIHDSFLVQRCTELCNKPISEFEVEDYRILIGQGIALQYIVPPAIDILPQDLFAEGDYYQGDLLKSILTIDESYWKENPILKEELKQICLRDFRKIETLELSDEIKESLSTLVKELLDQ